jgi:hypothetical protein
MPTLAVRRMPVVGAFDGDWGIANDSPISGR